MLHVCDLGGFSEVKGFIGGTHLVGRPDSYIQQTGDRLDEFNLEFLAPCHCTGFNAMSRLHERFPESFALNYCGREITVGEALDSRVL